MSLPRIVVVGIGGAGSNAISRMMVAGVRGASFVTIDSDAQALARAPAPTRVHIGEKLTRGLGTGGNPSLGERAAEDSAEQLAEVVRDADMVFLVAGLGGGTGTGAAPVIARTAREAGALTVGVVTSPFSFEGMRRARIAHDGVLSLRGHVDTLLTIACDRLLEVIDRKTTLEQAFAEVDDLLRQAIQGISELMTQSGLINVGFADVKTILRQPGAALLAIGRGTGETRAVDAARMAITSPLLDSGLEGAKSVLLAISGGTDLALSEVAEAADIVAQAAASDATIIFGALVDARSAREVRITLIATGSPPHGQLQAGFGRHGGGPPPPDSAPLGARLPRRPRAPSDHTAAVPEPAADPWAEPTSLPLPLWTRPRPPDHPGTGGEHGLDTGQSSYPRAS